MAIRSRYVGPDEIKRCVGGAEIPVVSRQAIVDAAIEAIIAADLNGGIISIVFGRRDTGFPNEKVTSEVVVTWQDRGAAKPQSEEILVLDPMQDEENVVDEPAETEHSADDDDLSTAEDEASNEAEQPAV